jgi:C4-type Zn-finger protein
MEIYCKCKRCGAELILRDKHYDVRTEDDVLVILRYCEFCDAENEEIIYLG